jgi:hypothetical protein
VARQGSPILKDPIRHDYGLTMGWAVSGNGRFKAGTKREQ